MPIQTRAITMVSLLLAAGCAPKYSVNLAVPATFLTNVDPNSSTGIERVITTSELSDRTGKSTHPLIGCRVEDHLVVVSLEADREHYPTSFPFTGECSYGKTSLDVTVVPMNPAIDPSQQPMTIDENSEIHIDRPNQSAILRQYPLPERPDRYVYDKRIELLGLEGSFCEAGVDSEGAQYLRVVMSPEIAAGVGVCRVPIQSGGTADFTVHLRDGGPIFL